MDAPERTDDLGDLDGMDTSHDGGHEVDGVDSGISSLLREGRWPKSENIAGHVDLLTNA
jgi:hypothetical protein